MTDPDEDLKIDNARMLNEDAWDAVASLLGEAQRVAVGILFVPSETGWHVGYLEGGRGGPLAEGPELATASAAALAQLRRGWPRTRDDVPGDAFSVVLPQRDEVISWPFADDRYIRCTARTVRGPRCMNGVFDGQPGYPVKVFDGPSGEAFDISAGDPVAVQADLQRCVLHAGRDNPDAIVHEGTRYSVSRRASRGVTVR